MNKTTENVTLDTVNGKDQESASLDLEVRRSRKVRTGIKAGSMGGWGTVPPRAAY